MLRDVARPPVQRLGPDEQPRRRHVRKRRRMRHDGEAERRAVGADVDRRVDVDADEVERARDDLRDPRGVNFGASAPALRRYASVYCPSMDDRHVRRVQLARRLSAPRDVLRRSRSTGSADRHVLGRGRPWCPACALARIACTASPCAEHRVVPRLVEAARRQLQPGRVDADAVAQLDERAELVDREDVLDAIGQPARRRSRRSRRRPSPCRASPSRRRCPAAPAAGPSDRASRTARCRWRAARRPAGCRSRGPSGWARRVPCGKTRGQAIEKR